jgi:hypothetical protein
LTQRAPHWYRPWLGKRFYLLFDGDGLVAGQSCSRANAARCPAGTAARLGRDRFTVRNWLRSFSRLAEAVRAHFIAFAYALDPDLPPIEPTGDALRDALAALGVAVRAAIQRYGPCSVWPQAARLSNGRLLSNTICHLARPS